MHKHARKEPFKSTLASVKKEMAKPRMAKSARIAELRLDTARVSEQPSTTMPGTVDKIIPTLGPSEPEKAQIAVDVADHRYRNLRIENRLTDENGNDVRLKKGAHVEVTVSPTKRRQPPQLTKTGDGLSVRQSAHGEIMMSATAKRATATIFFQAYCTQCEKIVTVIPVLPEDRLSLALLNNSDVEVTHTPDNIDHCWNLKNEEKESLRKARAAG